MNREPSKASRLATHAMTLPVKETIVRLAQIVLIYEKALRELDPDSGVATEALMHGERIANGPY